MVFKSLLRGISLSYSLPPRYHLGNQSTASPCSMKLTCVVDMGDIIFTTNLLVTSKNGATDELAAIFPSFVTKHTLCVGIYCKGIENQIKTQKHKPKK